jgi:hypothetical protein
LIAPAAGFEAAFRSAERRERAGRKPAEGTSPYVMAFLGGAALMSLWLKVAGMTGVRNVSAAEVRWHYMLGALVGGGLLGILGQNAWAAFARLAAKERVRPPARDLRMVWGAAALPQVIGLVVLLPLDLTIVGMQTYATDKLADPVSTMWAAMSIAIAVSLAVWSLILFVRGTQIALRSGLGRALLASGVVVGVGLALAGAMILATVIS